MADESLPYELFRFVDLIDLATFSYYSLTVDNYDDMSPEPLSAVNYSGVPWPNLFDFFQDSEENCQPHQPPFVHGLNLFHRLQFLQLYSTPCD
jgi:hypothetical protein